VGIRGHEGVIQIKTYHASFPKVFIEVALKDAPGGVFIALEGTSKDEVPLVALGYRYSRNVDWPQVISNFFGSSNKIDIHNQLHQDCLKLEKQWITQDPYFHLGTTFVGINVTDTFLLENYHKLINYSSNACEEKELKVSTQRFSGILAHQLIEFGRKLNEPSHKYLPDDNDNPLNIINVYFGSTGNYSSPTVDSSLQRKRIFRSLSDVNGTSHHLVKYDVTLDPSGR